MNNETEISTASIVARLKRGKFIIALGTLLFFTVGLLTAIFSDIEFRAGTRLMPELQSKNAGGLGKLGSLAGLAGVNLDNLNSSDAIRPDLYPNILQSTSFSLFLLNQEVYSETYNKLMTLEQYFVQKEADSWSIGKAIASMFSDGKNNTSLPDPKNYSKTLRISKAKERIIKDLKERVLASLDKKTGIISIDVKMPEAIMAATVARVSTEYLTNYVTKYRTGKLKTDVTFLEGRTSQARKRYENTQYALSAKKDRTLNAILSITQDQTKKLQFDFDIAYGLYTDLSRKLEEAKIKVQEESMIFETLDPPQVPLLKSEPRRGIMILVFTIIGAILSVGYALARDRN